MKRIHVLAVALAAVFVASVVVVSAASALEFLLALWLEGATGIPVTTILLVEQTGELQLTDTKTLLGSSSLLCSGTLDGWIGPESLDQISELLNLNGILISLTVLSGEALACIDQTGLCPEPLVWAEGLPWETEVELLEETGGPFFADLLFKGEYEVECMGNGLVDLCSAPVVAVQLKNEPGGVVDAEFSDAFQELAGLNLGECSLGGSQSVVIAGLTTILESGVTLTVSE
jgi:hypothetical protein